MGGRLSRRKLRSWSAGTAALLGLSLGLACAIDSAQADKVGVAAAVNPDAFSSLSGAPQSQLSIGKSIFYNERINTTGSGLVQVLLVDGSTFTVGPGSDLVIDKFVYNPNKGTGQITASFSKGVARFVGGKISKNENGVTVKTPAGALAIRGGMAQWKLNGASGIFSFLYGKEMSLGKHTVWEPGYTIDTTSGVPNIRPTTSADIATIMASLTNGSTGGIGGKAPDAPKPAELVSTQSLSQLISDATATQIQGEIDKQLNQPQSNPAPPPETVPLPTDLTLRVLTAPEIYVADKRTFWSPGIFIANPGAHGILGGDDAFNPCFLAPEACGGSPYGFFKVTSDDFSISSTSIANGRVQGTIPEGLIRRIGLWGFEVLPEAEFDLPIFNVVGVHPVTNAVVVDVNGTTTLVGSAFTGRGGGFFAYQLFELGENGLADLNKPVLAFGGTPFQKPETETDQLRLFNLFTDPRQNIGIPFAAKSTTPTNLAGATIQPLYLLESTGETGRSVWLQTSFLIQGTGASQETVLVLALGEQNEDGQLEGFRRGMSRINLILDPDNNPNTPNINRGMQTINFAGQISTLAGADGETHVFGTTLPHFIIGADSTGNGHHIFQDQPLNPGAWAPPNQNLNSQSHNIPPPPPPPSAFAGATYHIGQQAAQTTAPQPVTTDADVDFYGYASGIYQQTASNLGEGEAPVGMLLNSDPTQVHLKFKTDNRLSALFSLHGEDGVEDGGASLAFGDWGGAKGRSAVINGNIYAAVESATVNSTVLVDGYYPGQQIQRTADTSLYLVSGGLLNPNVAPCTNCDFIKWGTWGGQVKFKDGFGYWQQDVTAHVNLGWYVAGDLTTVGQIDTLAATGATASYAGSVVGNVASLGETGWNTYVATGDLAMNWNFGQRSGDLTISNFDSRSYGTGPGGLTQPSVDFNKFGGSLSQLGGPSIGAMTGSATGSFVNNGASNPAAGVIGNWNVRSDTYGATGVFAGRQ